MAIERADERRQFRAASTARIPARRRGELGEPAFGERRIREGGRLVERPPDAGSHRLGEMLQDVAGFVNLTAMDERRR